MIEKIKQKFIDDGISICDMDIPTKSNYHNTCVLSDILEQTPDERFFVKKYVIDKIINTPNFSRYMQKNGNVINDIYDDYNSRFRVDNISGTLTCNIGSPSHRNGQKVIHINGNHNSDFTLYDNNKIHIRRLTINECEKLQSYPINYTEYGLFDNNIIKQIPDNARYKMIGNGITSNVSKTVAEYIFNDDVKYKVMSLFTGCGGTEALLDENKFETIGFSEIDKNASAVFKYHHPNIMNYGDLTKIDYEKIHDFDILFGGFPCQSFSIAGLRKGFGEKRGQLIFNVFDLITIKKPKYLMMENVRGLLSHDKGKTFESIIKGLCELGYDVDFQLLNSKNFGVAQNRERVFIIAKCRNVVN